MQCNVMHQAYGGFYFILKKHLKLSQKTDLLAHFERFLVHAFLHPVGYTPIFCQSKFLMEVIFIIVESFISVAFVAVKLLIFKCFHGDAASMKLAPFGGFLGPFSPKYGTSLLTFRPEVVSHKTNTVSEQSFKIKCLCGNRTYPKLTNLFFFPETTSL